MAAVAVIVVFAVLSLAPRFLRAQIRGSAVANQLGMQADFVPVDDGDGVRRVNIGIDQFTAAMIGARLTAAGVEHQIYAVHGGELGGANCVRTLLYHRDDEAVVADVLEAAAS